MHFSLLMCHIRKTTTILASPAGFLPSLYTQAISCTNCLFSPSLYTRALSCTEWTKNTIGAQKAVLRTDCKWIAELLLLFEAGYILH